MVGFWRTRTIASAVKLGIPEALPATEVDIAEHCDLSPDGTRRLLCALGELGLTCREEGIWQLTPRGAFLRRDHPMTLADAAIEYADVFSEIWADLPQAISAASSWTALDPFEQAAQDDLRSEMLHRSLQSYAYHDYPQVIQALDLRDGDRVIDAGGGLGVLARLIVQTHPSLSVTVLERPEVVRLGQGEKGMQGVHWHEANIFEPWGVATEVVILARVLHDWDDSDAMRILQCAHQALAPGGRVFIIERLTSEENFTNALCDLHLLMVTGGRERSAEHYDRLLAQAGFKPTGASHLPELPSVIGGVAL